MISHIDVSSVLKRSVCDLYSNLVTRPTGAAVRIGIEHHLDEIGDKALAVLDFSHVGLLNTWPAIFTAILPGALYLAVALVALRWAERH